MRCSTRLLLVTAFAIFAGLGLLAASTRTVAREVARPRCTGGANRFATTTRGTGSQLSSAPPSSPTASALAADRAVAGLVAERRAAFPAGCPNASSALSSMRACGATCAGWARCASTRRRCCARCCTRRCDSGKAALLLNRTGTYVVARADFWEDQHARRCVRGLRETFADAFGGFASRARAPLVLVFNFESNARETRKSFPTLSPASGCRAAAPHPPPTRPTIS